MPARSLRIDPLEILARCAGTFVRSTSSSVRRSDESRPVAFAFVLWQATQYLSRSAR